MRSILVGTERVEQDVYIGRERGMNRMMGVEMSCVNALRLGLYSTLKE